MTEQAEEQTQAKHTEGRTSRKEAAKKAAETRRLKAVTVPGLYVGGEAGSITTDEPEQSDDDSNGDDSNTDK